MRRIHVSLAVLAAAVLGLGLIGGSAAAGAAQKQAAKKHKAAKKKPAKKRLKTAPRITSGAPYKARGSVGDAYVEGAKPGTRLLLVNARNKIVRSGVADSFGSKIFYDVTPGALFTVRTPKGKRRAQGTKRFRVLKPGANPPQSFYENKPLHAGLNYVTMRDGTELAVTVRLPFGKTSLSQGSFPTFIEYSGYQTAAPHDLLTSVIGGLGGGVIPEDPLAPATSTAVGAIIGPLLDFATVSVQMRGSGCSGGAFDLFGWPTTYDGYDVIETVAAQDWVAGGKVSMGGISFSGISQLFTAGTRPPHLSAVAPLSVTDDVYYGTGFPGGIFNDGFAYSWITERANDAKPAPEGGQPWAKAMTTDGDPQVTDPALREDQKQHCIANQRMRLQTRNYNHLIETNPYRTPALFQKRSPGAWVKNIDVPIFWVGAFQDEQTGGHWSEAVKNLPKSNSDVWVTMENGVHVDSLGPSTITRWAEFMNLFTGDGRIPHMSPIVIAAGPVLYQFLADAGSLPIQPSRYQLWLDTPQNLAKAKADFRKDPRIRVLMDNGDAVPGQPGAIGGKWETQFSDWPVPSLKPTTWYLGRYGTLSPQKPGKNASVSYRSDPSARPARTLGANAQGDSWKAQPPYNWKPVVAGKGLGFVTPALDHDVFIAGPSSLDLYLRSNMRNTDIQVTLTEVRPDGKETYVQNGWLRSSHRALNRKASTPNDPVQTWLKKDAAPLRKGRFNYERIQIFPVAHVFRKGSKIRLNIQAPGGDRTIWNFQTIEKGKTVNTIGLGGVIPSRLVLPVIPGQDAQGTALPGATALRGQPSRDYVPAGNGG
ncbi:MAG: CocE/NonD family hydrolase [Solirubrobacterales bacterium]|nr:CocE/NonD family hydrolase [Solirubrobacterales bacterium]